MTHLCLSTDGVDDIFNEIYKIQTKGVWLNGTRQKIQIIVNKDML